MCKSRLIGRKETPKKRRGHFVAASQPEMGPSSCTEFAPFSSRMPWARSAWPNPASFGRRGRREVAQPSARRAARSVASDLRPERPWLIHLTRSDLLRCVSMFDGVVGVEVAPVFPGPRPRCLVSSLIVGPALAGRPRGPEIQRGGNIQKRPDIISNQLRRRRPDLASTESSSDIRPQSHPHSCILLLLLPWKMAPKGSCEGPFFHVSPS